MKTTIETLLSDSYESDMELTAALQSPSGEIFLFVFPKNPDWVTGARGFVSAGPAVVGWFGTENDYWTDPMDAVRWVLSDES